MTKKAKTQTMHLVGSPKDAAIYGVFSSRKKAIQAVINDIYDIYDQHITKEEVLERLDKPNGEICGRTILTVPLDELLDYDAWSIWFT